MKKRFAFSTVLMSTALVLGTTSAFATTSSGRSTAKIEFTTIGKPVLVDPDSPDPTKPYDPIYDPKKPDTTDPNGNGNTPTGNTGPLTLDYAPNFNFGSHESDTITNFKALDKKPFLQVTDRRALSSVWNVKVKLGAFENSETNQKSLTNATLTIEPGIVQTLIGLDNLLAPKSKKVVLTAGNPNDEENILTSVIGTFSTWQVYWKGSDTLNSNIFLDVPVNAQVQGTHTATLDWTLTDAVN